MSGGRLYGRLTHEGESIPIRDERLAAWVEGAVKALKEQRGELDAYVNALWASETRYGKLAGNRWVRLLAALRLVSLYGKDAEDGHGGPRRDEPSRNGDGGTAPMENPAAGGRRDGDPAAGA